MSYQNVAPMPFKLRLYDKEGRSYIPNSVLKTFNLEKSDEIFVRLEGINKLPKEEEIKKAAKVKGQLREKLSEEERAAVEAWPTK